MDENTFACKGWKILDFLLDELILSQHLCVIISSLYVM